MLNRSRTVKITEFDLPMLAGSFALTMSKQHFIVNVKECGGKPLLLVEEVVGNSTKPFQFRTVESGDSLEVTLTFENPLTYLDSYQAGGRLLHLYGERSTKSSGGALSV